MFDSFNDSELKTSPRLSSASISFSTHGTFPMDYSSEIDIDNENDSLLLLPISPVSQDNEEEEDDNDEHEGSSASKEECTDVVAATVEADTTLMVESTSDSIIPSVPNELSISTSQTSHCDERNSNGQSPLSISSSKCFLEGMKLLIERGANINLQDSYGRTPLQLVCESTNSDNHHESIDYLLQHGANPCIQDLQGRTSLHIAAAARCVHCINKLMEHKADPNVRDSSGDIPLHIATKMMHLECMEALSPSCEDSASSVDSTSSILQFGNDSSFYQLAGDRSIPRSMQEITSASAVTTGKESWHDSGYFTARGNAWTKSSKYYQSNKIEEEIDSSQSTLHSESDSLSQQENVVNHTGGELTSTRRVAALSLQFILRLALYLIDSFLGWLRNCSEKKSPQMMHGSNVSTGRQEGLSFKEPPAHIKQAMDRFKQQQDMQS